jgi:uncharacterized protein YqgV (UPF0045/DUF77 family)
MIVQAEVSLYPLRTEKLSRPIEAFCRLLTEAGLEIRPGPMSSYVLGDSTVIFPALQQAFKHIADKNEIVMTLKISNACPINKH